MVRLSRRFLVVGGGATTPAHNSTPLDPPSRGEEGISPQTTVFLHIQAIKTKIYLLVLCMKHQIITVYIDANSVTCKDLSLKDFHG